jgi:hypothetical protein
MHEGPRIWRKEELSRLKAHVFHGLNVGTGIGGSSVIGVFKALTATPTDCAALIAGKKGGNRRLGRHKVYVRYRVGIIRHVPLLRIVCSNSIKTNHLAENVMGSLGRQ